MFYKPGKATCTYSISFADSIAFQSYIAIVINYMRYAQYTFYTCAYINQLNKTLTIYSIPLLPVILQFAGKFLHAKHVPFFAIKTALRATF